MEFFGFYMVDRAGLECSPTHSSLSLKMPNSIGIFYARFSPRQSKILLLKNPLLEKGDFTNQMVDRAGLEPAT